MSELDFARQRLRESLADVLRLEGEERVRRAYEHGFKAGERSVRLGVEVDRTVYRRGYQAGYKAGRRDAPAFPDGSATVLGGRPRKQLVYG